MQQIYNTEELKRIMNVERHNVSILLTQDEIEKWKKNGNFAHLKKELIVLPKIKFSCTKLENGDCMYYFILNTIELMNRVYTMLHELYYGSNKVPLVKCKDKYSGGFTSPSVEGSAQFCSLFG